MSNFEKQIQIVLDDSKFSNVELIYTSDNKKTFNVYITNTNSSYEIQATIDENININNLENNQLRTIITKSLIKAINEEYEYTYDYKHNYINTLNYDPSLVKETLQTLLMLQNFYEAIAKTIKKELKYE